jgi:TonB family protein
MLRCLTSIIFLLLGFSLVPARSTDKQVSITVLEFGNTSVSSDLTEKLRTGLRSSRDFIIADVDLSMSAARGIGYSGSLNLSIEEARDLGAALAVEYFFLGDAQTLRRSSSQKPVYYESYCSVFIVSARTGKLVFWDRPSFENDEATKATQQLSQHFERSELHQRYADLIRRSRQAELAQRSVVVVKPEAVIEAAPDDEKIAEEQGLRLPRPFRRFRPEYPATAAQADAEATVDVLVDVGADGEIGAISISRWAGFGLDESTLRTVGKMHFFPALKNGTPIPMRVLLRYNFRRQPR